jgi:hypothetical protein
MPSYGDDPGYLVHLVGLEEREQERLNPPGRDPMYLMVDGIVSQSSSRFTAPVTGIGYTGPGGTIPPYPPDGPPVTDPMSGGPYTALRVTLEGLGAANGAMVRFVAGAPYGGGRVERVIMVTAATPVALMAGKYNSVRLELLVLEPNATLNWEWFNDTSGVVQGTNMYTPTYDVNKGAIIQCPAGSERLYVNETAVIDWGVPNLAAGAVPLAVNTWDKAGTVPVTAAGVEGVAVQGPEFTINNPLPGPTVTIQWRLTNL